MHRLVLATTGVCFSLNYTCSLAAAFLQVGYVMQVTGKPLSGEVDGLQRSEVRYRLLT